MPRVKNPLIKKANLVMEYTPQQLVELDRCSEDPIYFIDNFCKMQHPVEGAIPFHPRDYQKRMISTFKDNRFSIVLSARQTGKSWTAGAYLLWFAMFHFDKTILIASNKNSNAMEMIHRIRFIYEHLPLWLKPGVTDDGWNKHGVSFDNKSRIISTATSEDAGRGLSISLLFLDEFAFVKPNIQEDFWMSMSPTLATGGSCIICSTPNGNSNKFAHLWRGAQIPATHGSKVGSNGFAPVRVKWDDPPGRDEKFKEGEIARLGERLWLQEYECEFLSSDALLFDSLVVLNLSATVENLKPLETQGDIIWFKKPLPHTTYLMGIDPASGSGNDYTAVEVFEFPSLEQVCEYRTNTTSPAQAYVMIKKIMKVFERVGSTLYFTIENNSIGQSMIALYEADEYPVEAAEFVSESGRGKYGMTTTAKSKMRACLTLKEMVENNNMGIKSIVLVKEMQEFVRKGGTYTAGTGATDDCIMSLVLIIRLLEEISSYDQEAYDKLYSYSSIFKHNNEEDEYDDDDTPLDFLI